MTDLLKIFSEQLRKYRGKQNQVDFARFLGLNQATYQRYEAMERKPDGIICLKIASKIGITVEELLTGKPPNSTVLEREAIRMTELLRPGIETIMKSGILEGAQSMVDVWKKIIAEKKISEIPIILERMKKEEDQLAELRSALEAVVEKSNLAVAEK